MPENRRTRQSATSCKERNKRLENSKLFIKSIFYVNYVFSTANHNGKIYRRADNMGRELRETFLPFHVLAWSCPIRCSSRPDGDARLSAWHTACQFPASRFLFNFCCGRLISCRPSADRSSWAWPCVFGSPCRKLLFIAGIIINLVLDDDRPRCSF